MSGHKATICYCDTCPTCCLTAPRPAVADPLVYRHGAIKGRLLARISSVKIDGKRPLAGLSTRDYDDPAIALIDAVAGSLHVLAWNAARLSNDGSIRRTEDREALIDLTRLLGYELRPALAATTTLAFTIDQFEGSPKVVTIPKGTKVASIPGQDEKPQTFETDVALEARVEWNTLKPVLQKTVPQVSAATTTITIANASTTVKPGDLVLAYLEPQASPVKWLCARVALVTPMPDLDPPCTTPPRTQIDLVSPLTLPAIGNLQDDIFKNQVVVLGQRATAFGATAPDLSLMSKDVRKTQLPQPESLPTEWRDLKMSPGGNAQGGLVDLDAVYPDAMPGRFVVFSRIDGGTNTTQVGRITSATELSRKGFGLSAKVTRIGVKGIDLTSAGFLDKVRETAIYMESARERLLVVDADEKMPPVPTDRITVQGTVNLPNGRCIVLSGDPWTSPPGKGPKIVEVATMRSRAPVGDGNTELVFERVISSSFRSTTLCLLANCVGASHGDTPVGGAERIGSGSAANATPRFLLKGSPLAYVPAANPRGFAPAIEVRVDDRLYTEKPTLFGLGSEDRAYTVKTVREGKSEVQFAGRLPSGTHNVSALYRTGGGVAGNLAAGRITTVMAPVLGVGRVTNPAAAQGGSDAETIDDMRTAAPQSIRTLDRVVSLADFEAFARTRRGVGKALATELYVGLRCVVCLTIATTDLAPPVAGSDLVNDLRRDLTLVTVPGRSIRIEGFTDLTAQLSIALVIDPMFRRADVEAAVRAKLREKFGRAARNFGEALHRSAVFAAVHEVKGVVAAQLPVFVLPAGLPEDEGRLLCPVPAMAGGQFINAGLLSINADQVLFAEMLP